VDLLRSVSRALPAAARPEEGKLITRTRQLLGAYDRAEMMVQAGLYSPGSDPVTDAAVAAWPALDGFIGAPAGATLEGSFASLREILDAVDPELRGKRAARAMLNAQ